MSNIDYIKIFKRAWSITWRNRFLWWFGFFVALAGSGGCFNFPVNNKWERVENGQIMNFVSDHIVGIIIGAVILCILLIIFLILGVIGRGALIKGTERIVKNEPANFKIGMQDGKKYFWKLLFQDIILGLCIIVSLLVLFVPVAILFATKTYITGTLVAILAVFIFIPLMILIVFLRLYGRIYLVLGNAKIISSLELAYELLMKNKLASIVMGLLFIPIGLVLLIAFIALAATLAIIFVPLGLIFNLILAKVGLIFVIALGFLCLLAAVFLMKSVYEVFTQAAWVLFFHEIATPKVKETVTEAEPEKEKTLPVVSPVKTAE